MITNRQEKILNSLMKEYIGKTEPVSSELLKKKCILDISTATIRNELQVLTEKGYIEQPHTSAGRIPTDKAYRYFVNKVFTNYKSFLPDFIAREVDITKQKIKKELELVKELKNYLEEISSVLDFKNIEEDVLFDVLRIVSISGNSYKKNIDLMKDLLNELEDLSI